MLLYRIRNKQTGKFFNTGSQCPENWRWPWTSTGVFYRNIDTIRKHLKNLTYDNYFDRDGYDRDKERGRLGNWSSYYKRKEHHPERINILEVIVNDVTLNGEKCIEAKDILN